ncbi:acyltransferase [Marinobacter salinisoli]|uniref:Acyltransferase n=1 Tax=Marinobacter salinisoli TaxID=2769486 RepID=A0ABX7MN63_9GAMM|nr:acyltransferase [Marinobacter salinisoli]QSP93685.1 acyltransferase [Marinobacter salinisoli]
MTTWGELKALTSLRGIAALFVVFHHGMYVTFVDIGASIPTKLFLNSYLWVDLFFILSGFVLAYVYDNQFCDGVSAARYRQFIRSRFARIYPLHLFTLSLFVAFEGIQWALHTLNVEGSGKLGTPFTGNQSIESLITNILLVQTFHWEAYWNEPSWSISAEWIIYFIIPAVIAGMAGLTLRSQLVLAFIAFIPLVLIELYFGDLGLLFAGWPMLFRCLSGAVLGILVFKCFRQDRLKLIGSANLVLPVLVLNLTMLHLGLPDVVAVAGFAWLTLCASRVPNNAPHILHHPWLHYLGQISYSIYLIHWLFLDIIRDTAIFFTGKPIVGLLNLGGQWVTLFLIIGMVVATSHWTYRAVEVPMRTRLKRPSDHRRLTGHAKPIKQRNERS